MKTNIVTILFCTAFLITSCEKEIINTPNISNNETYIDNANAKTRYLGHDYISEPLSDLETQKLREAFEDEEIWDSLDIGVAKKFLIKGDGTNDTYSVIIPFERQHDTSISKSLTVVLRNYVENGLRLCKIIENSSITVALSRISESYSSTITHLETKAVIQFKGNGEVILPNFPYCPERPTWWDCMQTSFTEFTSDLAGVIAIGLYPEVIIGIMSANCWRISAGY